MDVLIIGVSSVFIRRVLPGLLALPGVGKIHLATRRSSIALDIPREKLGTIYHCYDLALQQTNPCLAYISLPNSLHFEWAKIALQRGFHVVVDKPACIELREAEEIVRLARSKRLCVAEATVWPYHPQVSAASEIFASTEGPRTIHAVFSFPPLNVDNFRNKKSMGGGCLLDLGPYAASVGRIFFGEVPTSLFSWVLSKSDELGIDTGFAVTALYSRGRIFQGYFSFDGEYKNSLELMGPRSTLRLEPAFTSSGNATHLHFRSNSQAQIVPLAIGDPFLIFFDKVIRSLRSGEFDGWADILIQDARMRDLINEGIVGNV
ncbi:Gfo/Idh/MocA family protein [Piscinibacter sakaiensis]|uniref:Gfo/Idh/MocA family protein n=1 Tax=Piscinibacter sakaiensis TaxID=1547922 RepID=UPI003AADB0EE